MARIRSTGQSGLTLIELMVAMVLGLLVAAGIITVFISTSSSNQAQTQLATLQETGRFAVTRLKGDLSMANGQYCSNTGGNAQPSSNGPYLDGLRSPTVYAHADDTPLLLNALSDVTTSWGDPYPNQPDAVYSLPPFLSMRGYDCTKNACTPVDPHGVIGEIPAMGTEVGDRVVGTSVLTLRYLDGSRGWSIGQPGGSTIVPNTDGTLAQVNLVPLSGEPPAADFKSGDLAMLANCSGAQVFAVDGGGTGTLQPNTYNFAKPSGQQAAAGLKLFDFNRAYQTVTYYVQVVKSDNHDNTTGALMRRVNGDKAEELVRGIERLDFKYGVLDSNGATQFLTAAQVDAVPANCPPSVPIKINGDQGKGCLWRSVKSIEVDLLMDGQTPLHTLTPDELGYTYAADSITEPGGPDDHAIKPDADQGFPRSLLRREFMALISVRNYNP